jgi:DNA topoisomerase-3
MQAEGKEERGGGAAVQDVAAFDTNKCSVAEASVLDKKTSPPEDFQIDTLLAFMERPGAEAGGGKLAGLGTPATRAEIIKTLFDRGYIEEQKKRLLATKKGLWLLKRLKADKDLEKIADVAQTTAWEKQLETDPAAFEQSVEAYVRGCIKPPAQDNAVWEREAAGICPLCGNKVYEGKKSWFCSAWKSVKPCTFAIWKEVAGARLSGNDARLLLEKKKTPVKSCTSKAGKKFKAAFALGGDGKLAFIFK